MIHRNAGILRRKAAHKVKIIDNYVIVDANDSYKQSILINTLYSTIYILSNDETKQFRNWVSKKEIVVSSDIETNLLMKLDEAGFVVDGCDRENEIINEITTRIRQWHKKRQKDHLVVFVLTYNCNFSCPYCYEDSYHSSTKILTEQMVDKVFDLYKNRMEYITFYGGEPLLPETMEIIRYISEKAPYAIYNVTTNGYHLTDYYDLLSNLSLSNIMVTMDGSRETHNKTRIHRSGVDTYEKVYQGIDLYLRSSIPMTIRMNISNDNLDQCLKLRDGLIREYKTQFDNGVLKFELQPQLQLAIEARQKLNDWLLFDTGGNAGIPNKYNMMSLSVSPILREFINSSNKKNVQKYCFCDAQCNRRYYDAEGNIYSCILALKNTHATIGKYYPQLCMKKDSMISRNIETVAKCADCKLKFICGGGCSNKIMDKNGNVFKPNCDDIRNEVYNELPRLFRKYTERPFSGVPK